MNYRLVHVYGEIARKSYSLYISLQLASHVTLVNEALKQKICEQISIPNSGVLQGGDIGGQGMLGPPTFYPGGAEHLTTGLSKVPKLPYYWLGICTVRRESISKLSSSSRRGALPLFSSPRDVSSGKRTPHEY